MFRKIIALSVVMSLWAGVAAAKPCPHCFPLKPHRGPVQIVHHHSRGMYLAEVVGSAVGSFLAVSYPQTVIPEKVKCVVLKSRLTGEITKKCVSSDNLYEVKREVYDVLYVE